MDSVEGESWNLTSEYPAADSPEVEADLERIDELLAEIETRNAVLTSRLDRAAELTVDDTEAIVEARRVHAMTEEVARRLHDVDAFADCSLSVDSQDEAAQKLLGRLQAVEKRAVIASEPLSQFLDRVPEDVVDAYLADANVAASRFAVRHSRRRRHELLPLEQETLVAGLAQDGIHAWARLYEQLSGTLTCEVRVDGETRTMGVAEASGLLLKPDDALRETTWRAINAAWQAHEETCAAAINAIAGWRLEMCVRRSNGHSVHYLDAPLHMNRIERRTLDTLIGVARESVPLARRAARLQAKAYDKERYGPWDQRAPAPVGAERVDETLAYGDAVDLIATSYGAVDPEMGDFVRMMAANRWIEGTVGPRKRPGAYCTGFEKSRTPRVYMTYTGGGSDVITLAHEIGHGFHAWVMRDLPDSQRRYGMSIAETASTFGESVVRDALLGKAETPQAKLDIVWEDASALVAFVLNIPTRYEFERNFYDARSERPLRPAELNELMSTAWRKWYGDCLAEPDPLFWANKLHFYISRWSFYNFPYLFGYLFSLGVYAQRQALGDEFFPRYRALLRDTGRMTAEELAAKHLEVDLGEPEFWRTTLASLEGRIDHFEELVEARTG